jgi:hypothetical protein
MDDIFSRTLICLKSKFYSMTMVSLLVKMLGNLKELLGVKLEKKSIACTDWRLVDGKKKYELWTDMKAYYDIDAAALNWFMRTATMKWKQFKTDIKA